MRRILFFLMAMAVSFSVFAQKQEKQKVSFYGVDFSSVNVVGADESNDQFIDAFARINGLLLSEPAKYDVAKYLNLEVETTNIDVAVKQTEKLAGGNFRNKQVHEISLRDIAASYPDVDGNVLVIVAKELNKGRNSGTFIALIFDGKSKDVLSQREFTGKSKGFGLRNFWAGALYSGMKSCLR